MPILPYDTASHVQYVTTYDGITVALEGKPDGDFFQLTFPNNAVTSTEGVDGDVQYSIRKASSSELTSTMQWGSATNNILNQIYQDQEAGNYMQRTELKRINNTTNVLVVTCARVMLQKIPDYGIGAEAADRGWVFLLEKTVLPETQAPA